MTQLVDGNGALPEDLAPQPAEDLIPEVRQRTLRRRQRNVALVLVVVAGIVAYVIASAGKGSSPARATATAAVGDASTTSAQMVVTSSFTHANGSGRSVDWYSSDGMTVVETNYSANGNVTSTVRRTYFAKGKTIIWQSTAVFPQQHDWASNTTSALCPHSCSQSLMFNIYFATVAWNQHLLTTHQFTVVGKPIRLDGRSVVRIEPTGLQAPGTNENEQQIYIDPSDDEIVEEDVTTVPPPHVVTTTYRWLPATQSNLAHLQLNVPAGYRRVANRYAAGSLDPVVPK